MTTMTPTRKPKLTRRDGRATVYTSQHATKEPLWRDLLAGVVFLVALLVFTAVVLLGGLMIFG